MRFNHVATQAEKNRASARADALLLQFKSMTPAEAAAWVDANVTNIATAKTALKVFAKMLVILAKDV